MRRIYDVVVLGDGPTAWTIMDHYSKKDRDIKCLLLYVQGNEGAYEKGSKVVNSVISKLPDVYLKDVGKYEEIVKMKELSEILLKEQYRSSPAYLGYSAVGFRCCKSLNEFEALRSVNNFFSAFGASVADSTARFLQTHLGKNVNKKLLFPYEEHLWNVSTYMEILSSRISPEMIESTGKVIYDGHAGSTVKLVVSKESGSEIIYAHKVLVCLGVGNINFEKTVKQYENKTMQTQRFRILSYYKRIYSHELHLPRALSSIIVPEDGVCITNELNARQSIMYDTNSKFRTVEKFNQDILEVQLIESRGTISKLYPFLSRPEFSDFMCSMPVDPDAFHHKPQNHFRFIISPSVDHRIRYFNLPYFTAIAAAANNLSDLNSI